MHECGESGGGRGGVGGVGGFKRLFWQVCFRIVRDDQYVFKYYLNT